MREDGTVVRYGNLRDTVPADVRTRIVAERNAGRSLRQIATALTDDGIPTARGGAWHASTIKAVLASDAAP